MRAVLVEHGGPAGDAVTLAAARLANELLKAQQRADAIAAQERECRLREIGAATEAFDARFVKALMENTMVTIREFVPPREVEAALDRFRARLAGYVTERLTG